ncbi:hypothetical protein HZA96_03285 [Candidatus Woesearchaeota archaeon]|nr:hypothetical protein [Candidatus Woesearchaeota archaeon]
MGSLDIKIQAAEPSDVPKEVFAQFCREARGIFERLYPHFMNSGFVLGAYDNTKIAGFIAGNYWNNRGETNAPLIWQLYTLFIQHQNIGAKELVNDYSIGQS